MAKKNVRTAVKPAADEKPAREKAAPAGLGGLLLGVLTWFIGPISKENAIEWGKILVFAISVALVFRWSIAEPYKIPSGSMEPTLHGDDRFLRGDRVFVNKWIYGLRYPFSKTRIYDGRAPERFDIVVFKTPEENSVHSTLVKRIVGMPGERIHVDPTGRVTVNGQLLEEPDDIRYNDGATRPMSEALYGVLQEETYSVVPEGHYLVLGDNRGNSRDGRVFGWLPNGHILGRVSSIVWPPTRLRDFTGFSETWWWRTLVGVVALLVLVRLFLGRSWRIRKGVPAGELEGGDHLYVNRIAYGLPIPFTRQRLVPGRAPKRGELVVYHAPQAASPGVELLVGRVAGLPGEQVYIDNGKLTIDGRPVSESALEGLTLSSGNGSALYGRSKNKEYSRVPDGHYFIVSPDGDGALDSRRLGFIHRRDLVGPVAAVWWPPRRWRRIPT
jgi:signal peptidase I